MPQGSVADERATAHRLQHPRVPRRHPGGGRRSRPPLGLFRHRAPAHRRRAHRPVDARRPPRAGQADPGRGRPARRRGGQLDPPHRRRSRSRTAPVPRAGQRLGSPAGARVRRRAGRGLLADSPGAAPGRGAGARSQSCRSPAGSASPSAWRRTTPSPPPRSWPNCWPWSTRPRPPARRGVGQPSPAPDGRDASRGLRQPRPAHPARAGQGRPPQGRRRLAAGAARRGRGAGQGHAGAAGGRRLPALDLGRVGKALAPRDRGARGGAPPAPGSADQVAGGAR